MVFYLFICMLIFGIGDILGTYTKAKLSSVFVSLILFLILFLTNAIPRDIIEQAGLTQIGKWASPLLIFHMGTMINVRDLLEEWKTVIIAILSMIVVAIAMYIIMPILGKENSIVSIPILHGGIVATKIMADKANSLGTDAGSLAAALGAILYAVQKFVGAPFASYFGLKEAKLLLEEYRKTGINPNSKKSKNTTKKITFSDKYSNYYGNFTCFAIASFFGYLAGVLQEKTGISYSIWALVFGIVLTFLGVVPEKILDKAKASGLLNMAVFASIIPSLAKVKLEQLTSLGFNIILIFVITMVFLFLFMYILPLYKINGSRNLTLGISVCQLLGFPATFLVSNEIAKAISQNEEEQKIVMDLIMPKYVIAGITTVTCISIITAGIMEKFL